MKLLHTSLIVIRNIEPCAPIVIDTVTGKETLIDSRLLGTGVAVESHGRWITEAINRPVMPRRAVPRSEIRLTGTKVA